MPLNKETKPKPNQTYNQLTDFNHFPKKSVFVFNIIYVSQLQKPNV